MGEVLKLLHANDTTFIPSKIIKAKQRMMVLK